MSFRRPSHPTIVAYVALFIAVGTGVGFAATQITSSKQIKKGVVKGSDIKDGNVSAADIGGSAVGSEEIDTAAVGTDEIQDGSVGAFDVGLNALNGSHINEGTLNLANSFEDIEPSSIPISTGGGFGVPLIPAGNLASLENVPAGKYLVLASSVLGGDADGASVFCILHGAGQTVSTGSAVSTFDYAGIDHTPDSIQTHAILSSNAPFDIDFACGDDTSGASASDRSLIAVHLAN